MAIICDTCLTAETGFLESGSYSFNPSAVPPDRIYCVNGVPVAPPSKGAVAPLLGYYVGAAPGLVGSPATYTMSVGEQSDPSWTNLTGRPVSLFAVLNGLTTGTNGSAQLYATIVLSANGTVILRSPAAYYTGIMPIPLIGVSDKVAVASGASVSFSVSVTYTLTGASATAAINEFAFSYAVMGGTTYE